ncbi:putative magnesium-dependent phosphatase-like protein [Emericellopsis cladophorae]|uniref:Magnesium-dependent phosphatase-like protein n=1 Tax=Emericellopsis cladophorae TaxID=2686198 RepID=A0A9P9Y8P9_9HYPO|nr:putative magnesium-dependent phosphatase-like protein [Emericellopsis cladophorae]KAI6784844.1 putative magnesium-dependent phosphatase-like protein [Emericellopsis cladophorae]
MPKKLTRQPTLPISSTQPPASLTEGPLPKLIVFDLDYTLWPFWVDTHVTPPLKPNSTHSAATDRYGEDYAFYEDVPSILQALPTLGEGVKIGVASRTSAPSLARDLLKLLHLPPSTDGEKVKKAGDVFDAGMEIYPSCKIRHFEALHRRTGLKYEDMLFFDDEARNRDTETLGVTMYLVRDGVTWTEVEKGVAEWRRRRGYKAQ